MKIASFEHRGRECCGVVGDAGIVPLEAPLKDLLAAGTLEEAAARAVGRAALPAGSVTLLPPVPEPRSVIGLGHNYRSHVAEIGIAVPAHPPLFTRTADSFVGPGAAIEAPRLSEELDYEAELAVIIGRRARHVAAEHAMDHVAGYACFAENTVRDFQRHSQTAFAGKNFDRSGAFGPHLVTPDEVGDPHALRIATRLNGATVQDGTTADMIFPIPDIIAYLSGFMTLHPGDVLLTGTPTGVGMRRDPPLWLRPGDRLEIEIERVGLLFNPVTAEI